MKYVVVLVLGTLLSLRVSRSIENSFDEPADGHRFVAAGWMKLFQVGGSRVFEGVRRKAKLGLTSLSEFALSRIGGRRSSN